MQWKVNQRLCTERLWISLVLPTCCSWTVLVLLSVLLDENKEPTENLLIKMYSTVSVPSRMKKAIPQVEVGLEDDTGVGG